MSLFFIWHTFWCYRRYINWGNGETEHVISEEQSQNICHRYVWGFLSSFPKWLVIGVVTNKLDLKIRVHDLLGFLEFDWPIVIQ